MKNQTSILKRPLVSISMLIPLFTAFFVVFLLSVFGISRNYGGFDSSSEGFSLHLENTWSFIIALSPIWGIAVFISLLVEVLGISKKTKMADLPGIFLAETGLVAILPLLLFWPIGVGLLLAGGIGNGLRYWFLVHNNRVLNH